MICSKRKENCDHCLTLAHARTLGGTQGHRGAPPKRRKCSVWGTLALGDTVMRAKNYLNVFYNDVRYLPGHAAYVKTSHPPFLLHAGLERWSGGVVWVFNKPIGTLNSGPQECDAYLWWPLSLRIFCATGRVWPTHIHRRLLSVGAVLDGADSCDCVRLLECVQ